MFLLRCYPKITDFIFEIFNHAPAADYRFLPLYSYGFFVAMGFFAAATLAVNEMRRREKLGLMSGTESEALTGEAPTPMELGFYFILSFVFTYKITGIFAYQPDLSSGTLRLGEYFFSLHGSLVGGLILAASLTGYYYWMRHKETLPKPVKKKITVYPSERIGDLVLIAMVLGVLGSNLFNFLENPDDYQNFWSDPFGSVFSGLSVYGGLITAGIGFWIYAYRKKISMPHFFDAVCPGFMLANGLGRIGCQVSGDGDWGIANLAPKPDWVPEFLWRSNYTHNIIDADPGNLIPGCLEEHCNQLVHAAYPTPIYEFLMCTAVFVVLWALRKKLTHLPGMLFAVFMILIGIQRYSIEQWRDVAGRDSYGFFGMQFLQSELISFALVIIGTTGVVYLWKRYKSEALNSKH